MQSQLLQALDLAGHASVRDATRPPAARACDNAASLVDSYETRDSSGVPHCMLDPITMMPMARPLKVAVFNRTEFFERRLDAPPYEVYDAEVFERLMRQQAHDSHQEVFQPISPLTRLPIVTIDGVPATQPDDHLRAAIEAFLPGDAVVWEHLTPVQRGVIVAAIALLDTPAHAAVQRTLVAPPEFDHAFRDLFLHVTYPERHVQLDHDALSRFARLEHEHWHAPESDEDDSEVSSATSFDWGRSPQEMEEHEAYRHMERTIRPRDWL